MEFLTNTRIDFLGKRNPFLGLSLALILISLGFLVSMGLNLGIEFRGGTEVVLRFAGEPAPEELRRRLAAAGIGDAQIQRYGRPEAHEVLVRVARAEGEGESEGGDVSSRVTAALHNADDRRRLEAGGIDLNAAGPDGLARWLSDRLGDSPGAVPPEVRAAAVAICDFRDRHGGILAEVAEVTGLPEVTEEIGAVLTGSAFAGEFVLREVDFIGPSAGRELRVKTFWALGGALTGILLYIWLRFRFFWGLAAVIALVHDVLITLGVMSITQKDFSLPVVAGILAIIGYSLNDTIVVFDRIRENLRSARIRDLLAIVNQSINQNLSRTMLTSLTTLFVVFTLFFFGGEKLNSFALALIVGVLAGTYSSIFIASPVLLIWEKALGKKI